jgi:flagellar FliL protein
MSAPTKQRPERVATDVTHRGASPGSKTGGSGDAGQAGGKSKKPKKLKLIVGLLVLLLAGGAIAKFTVLASPAKPAHGVKVVAKPAKGPIVPLTDMTLNLTDGHYLRLTIALQTTKGTSDSIDTSEASQAVIDTYSNLTVAQLTGTAARNKAKDALLAKLQVAYPKEILDVLYTGFVMT